MKVLSGIDKVFFSSSVTEPSFVANNGAVTMITENEGEFTREMKTIKLANGQDLTTCTEYKFKFETADSGSFADIRGYADNGDKVAMVAYSETGGCLVWFVNCQVFYKEILDQKSGDLARLQVMVSATGENTLPINYGNNLIPMYIAKGEDADYFTTANSTVTSVTKDVAFTADTINAIQIDPTGVVVGLVGTLFNFPVNISMGTLTFYADVWKQNTVIEITVTDGDVNDVTDTATASADNQRLSVSVDIADCTGANYAYISIKSPSNVTTQVSNLVLMYNQTSTGLVE